CRIQAVPRRRRLATPTCRPCRLRRRGRLLLPARPSAPPTGTAWIERCIMAGAAPPGSGSDPPDDADAGLVPGEVCGDDGRAAVAPEGADARPDADPDEAGAEEIRAVLGAREPLVDDRSRTRHRAHAPREVLA